MDQKTRYECYIDSETLTPFFEVFDTIEGALDYMYAVKRTGGFGRNVIVGSRWDCVYDYEVDPPEFTPNGGRIFLTFRSSAYPPVYCNIWSAF